MLFLKVCYIFGFTQWQTCMSSHIQMLTHAHTHCMFQCLYRNNLKPGDTLQRSHPACLQTSSHPHSISLKVTLEWAQARPKDGTKRSAWETVISTAKPVMAMETRPLPGYHIRNSYWSKPICWDQNNKTTINIERRDLSVTHRQSHTNLYYPCCVEQQSELFLCMAGGTACVYWRGVSHQLSATHFVHILYIYIYSWTSWHNNICNLSCPFIRYN